MTTSTSSANATALPNRRHFVSSIAGAGALGLPALPFVGASLGPIEAMYPELLRLADAYDVAIEATWDAEERYEEPDRPRWHPATSEGGYKLESLPGNKCRCYLNDSDENVAELRTVITEPFVFDPTFAITEHSHRSRIERARKTLDQIEAWQTEDCKRRDAAGLTAAEAKEAEACAASDAQRDAIFAIQATTFRELAFQAAILTTHWDRERIGVVLERLAELAGVTLYEA